MNLEYDEECQADVGVMGFRSCRLSCCREANEGYERDDGMEEGCTCEPMSALRNPDCPIHGGTWRARTHQRDNEAVGGGGGCDWEDVPYEPTNWPHELVKFYKERGFLSLKQQRILRSTTGMGYIKFRRMMKERSS